MLNVYQWASVVLVTAFFASWVGTVVWLWPMMAFYAVFMVGPLFAMMGALMTAMCAIFLMLMTWPLHHGRFLPEHQGG